MQRLATLAIMAALISPTVASGQDYTFGDWARDQGYEPGDVMPDRVRIEAGVFSGLANLTELYLDNNTALTELNLEAADFCSLSILDVRGNVNITSVSLRSTMVSRRSLGTLFGGGWLWSSIGIGELDGITKMDLSGIDFVDITDLEPLYVMDDLTDLWLVNPRNLAAIALDELLDNLETIESLDTEGVLYMTEADYDAFNAAGGDLLSHWNDEQGHHVEFLHLVGGSATHESQMVKNLRAVICD